MRYADEWPAANISCRVLQFGAGNLCPTTTRRHFRHLARISRMHTCTFSWLFCKNNESVKKNSTIVEIARKKGRIRARKESNEANNIARQPERRRVSEELSYSRNPHEYAERLCSAMQVLPAIKLNRHIKLSSALSLSSSRYT